jgi:hypothetical protein
MTLKEAEKIVQAYGSALADDGRDSEGGVSLRISAHGSKDEG